MRKKVASLQFSHLAALFVMEVTPPAVPVALNQVLVEVFFCIERFCGNHWMLKKTSPKFIDNLYRALSLFVKRSSKPFAFTRYSQRWVVLRYDFFRTGTDGTCKNSYHFFWSFSLLQIQKLRFFIILLYKNHE